MKPIALAPKTVRQLGSQRALVVVAACVAMVVTPVTAGADEPVAPTLVKTTIVEDPEAGVTRTFFGEVVAKKTVSLGFQVGGRLIEFSAPEGEVIEEGAVIARLDPVPFEIAVEASTLALEQARRKVSRFERLVGTTISDAQLQDAKTEVRLAEVALRNAQYEQSQAILIAPFDAVVSSRNVANFSTIVPGTEVVRVHDLSEFRVDIEVPEVLIQQLGNNPNITLKGRFTWSDQVHLLAFREMNAETAEIGQTFRVTLAFEAIEDRLLLPGASMVVSATLHDFADGLSIPVSAVDIEPNGETVVYSVVEGADGLRVERTPIKMRVSDGGDIRVVEGLQPGVEIVAGGVSKLDGGQTVRRFNPTY